MKNIIKSIFLTLFFLVCFIDSPKAFAASLSAENSRNGANSLNNAVATSFEAFVIEQMNWSMTNMMTLNSADSGNNSIASNNGNSQIDTGETQANVNIANTSNTNYVNIPCVNCNNEQNIAKNIENGPNSLNLASSNSVNTQSAAQQNQAINSFTTDNLAQSGGNLASNNVGDSSIKTGPASGQVNLSNTTNQNTVLGTQSCACTNGNNLTKNISNAPISTNIATSDSVKTNSFAQANTVFDSFFNLNFARTGLNQINNNGGDWKLESGRVYAQVNLTNNTNLNKLIFLPL